MMTPCNAIAQKLTVRTARAMPRGCGAGDAIAGALTAGCDWVKSWERGATINSEARAEIRQSCSYLESVTTTYWLR